jgi:hypothetical protein
MLSRNYYWEIHMFWMSNSFRQLVRNPTLPVVYLIYLSWFLKVSSDRICYVRNADSESGSDTESESEKVGSPAKLAKVLWQFFTG